MGQIPRSIEHISSCECIVSGELNQLKSSVLCCACVAAVYIVSNSEALLHVS